jgi:hypothetical protein
MHAHMQAHTYVHVYTYTYIHIYTQGPSVVAKSAPRDYVHLPLCIIFACHGQEEDALMQCKKECNSARLALLGRIKETHWEEFVEFKLLPFRRAEELIDEISVSKPALLHLSCCEGTCKQQSWSCREIERMCKELVCMNLEEPHRTQVRLIVAKSTLSSEHIMSLLEGVDYIVSLRCEEHIPEIDTVDAFTSRLYRSLGLNMSLEKSFNQAETLCNAYSLAGRDPGNFFLPHSSILQKTGVIYRFYQSLEKKGLSDVAQSLAVEMAQKKWDVEKLRYLSEHEINKLSSLTEEYNRKMLLEEVACRCSPHAYFEEEGSTSDASAALTDEAASDSDSESQTSLCLTAARNVGNVNDFWQDITGFLKDFVSALDTGSRGCTWSSLLFAATLCSIFKNCSLQDKQQAGRQLQDNWRDPKKMMQLLDSIIRNHHVGSRFCDQAAKLPQKLEFFATVLAVDAFVSQCSIPDLDSWKEAVFTPWVENRESPTEFLQRANKFLHTCYESTLVLAHAVPTNSYVAVLAMDHMFTKFVHLYVNICKHQFPTAEVRDVLHGYTLFVSGEGACTAWKDFDMPSFTSLTIVIEGLRALAIEPLDFDTAGFVQVLGAKAGSSAESDDPVASSDALPSNVSVHV